MMLGGRIWKVSLSPVSFMIHGREGGVMPHGMIIDKIMDDNPRLPTKTKKGLHTFPELSIFRP